MQFFSKRAKRFLDLNWEQRIFKDQDLTHDELSQMIGFDHYPFSLKMCKRNFGLTTAKFLMHCRVAEVKQFLAQPESHKYELIEIAHMFGYPHRRNFNRNFLKVEGITQREFWFFLEHFKATTGMELVEYQQPELKNYMPPDEEPTFLSNFLNLQLEHVIEREKLTQ